MNSGCPPTARKARTGESTPPGSKFCASSKREMDLVMFMFAPQIEFFLYTVDMETGRENKREVQLYMENAREMLDAAKSNLENDFYTTSVNRSYYAVFYAANALLATLGEARSKHSGVISLFRQRFIKTGELPMQLSEIYEDLINS